jgi:hypothetical protein
LSTISTILGASGNDRIQKIINEAERDGITGILWQRPGGRCLRTNLGGVLICLGCFGIVIFYDSVSRRNFSPILKKVIDAELTSISGAKPKVACEEDLAPRRAKIANLVLKHRHRALGPWGLIRQHAKDVIKQQLGWSPSLGDMIDRASEGRSPWTYGGDLAGV